MKAVNIKWDIDTEEYEEDMEELPEEIEIPADMTDIYEIADYISDYTGFCHDGFTLDFDGTVIHCPKCGAELVVESDVARCECGWMCADSDLEELIMDR